jgi:Zn-dependent protease
LINRFKAYETKSAGSLSIQLGSIFGCRLRIHWSFIAQLMVTWLIYFSQMSALTDVILRCSFLVLIQFVCIFLHELGHLFAARGLGIATIETTLYCMGGVSRLSRIPTGKWQQIYISMAGPLVNFVISMVLFGAAHFAYHQNRPSLDGNILFLMSIATANMLLVLHNLAPAFPFDGGRLLQMLLATRLPNARAIQIPTWLGQISALLFGLSTLVLNPALIMNAFGIFAGASQQGAIAQANNIALEEETRNLGLPALDLQKYAGSKCCR